MFKHALTGTVYQKAVPILGMDYHRVWTEYAYKNNKPGEVIRNKYLVKINERLVNMKVTANLFIDGTGNLRVTKKDTSTYPRELAIQLVIDVPDIFFKRPMPRVEVRVPEEYVLNPSKEIAVEMVAPAIAEALKVEVKTVQDGLLHAIQKDQENG